MQTTTLVWGKNAFFSKSQNVSTILRYVPFNYLMNIKILNYVGNTPDIVSWPLLLIKLRLATKKIILIILPTSFVGC